VDVSVRRNKEVVVFLEGKNSSTITISATGDGGFKVTASRKHDTAKGIAPRVLESPIMGFHVWSVAANALSAAKGLRARDYLYEQR
jgi:hypothetical protein